MAIHTTYTEARAKLATLWDHVEQSRETIVIRRRGHEPMALLPAAEVENLLEHVHLLRSPRSAIRLFAALQSALDGEGRQLTIEELEKRAGVD